MQIYFGLATLLNSNKNYSLYVCLAACLQCIEAACILFLDLSLPHNEYIGYVIAASPTLGGNNMEKKHSDNLVSSIRLNQFLKIPLSHSGTNFLVL